MIHTILIRGVPILVQVIEPKLKAAVIVRHGAPKIDLIAEVYKCVIVRCAAIRREEPRKFRYPESAGNVDPFRVSAFVVVIETRDAGASNISSPEVQSTFIWFRLIYQEIRVVLPDEETLIVDRIECGG